MATMLNPMETNELTNHFVVIHPLDDLPDDAKTLMHIMQSLVMVSFPIEAWKQPRVPDSGAAWVEVLREPVI